jgi:hypothetical protein
MHMVGGFGVFFNKARQVQPEIDISPIRNELKKQNDWIMKLHAFSRDLHGYARYIEHSNAKHKREILENVNNLVRWVDYLHSSQITLKKEFNDLKITLNKTMRRDFEIYHKTMEEYLTLKLKESEVSKEELKKEVFNEVFSELKKEFLKQQPEKKEATVQQLEITTNAELTNPEKELLNMLFNESKPMTYEAMAKKLGKTVNSVRVYMNSLRTKKPIIEEFSAPNGSKVFSIKNSEMVKTLFNLR